MEIKVNTVPLGKDEDVCLKIEKLVEDRNKVIAKRFNVEAKDIGVKLYHSTGSLRTKIDPNGDMMGIYAGYVDGQDEILLTHPAAMAPVYKDNLDKEIIILTDYCLTKFYICKVFYPEVKDFKLYYKYVSEALAGITSGHFQESIIKFDIKTFSEDKRYKKDKELLMVFYIMLEKSGIDFIYEHLNNIMKECDIKKSIFAIYKKSFSELISLYQRDILADEKKLQQTFKPGRVR